MIDATPDFKYQLYELKNHAETNIKLNLEGILLTHAHIGHYTGLMHLGREAMGTKSMPVYVMPRMFEFLSSSGPWDQLVRLKNIKLEKVKSDSSMQLSESITVKPIEVPHRDEYTETVGYIITGPNKSCLYISDIDKWEYWDKHIEDFISEVDYAFLDATFFDGSEIPGRNMSEIPHPFIVESMSRFKDISDENKEKIHFIHFNHTNPVLQPNHPVRKLILDAGYKIAEENMMLTL